MRWSFLFTLMGFKSNGVVWFGEKWPGQEIKVIDRWPLPAWNIQHQQNLS
jgi:hypothetical protein